MSDDTKLFTSGATETFVAASFVVAILALGMSIFNFSYTTQYVNGLLELQVAAVTMEKVDNADQQAEAQAAMEALVLRVDALEATIAAVADEAQQDQAE